VVARKPGASGRSEALYPSDVESIGHAASGTARAPGKREAEATEHHEVGVEPDALDTPYLEEREAVLVLQAAKLPLD
jgi:hypothetical protein